MTIELTKKQKQILNHVTEENIEISKMDDWELKYETKALQQEIDAQIKKQAYHMEQMQTIMKSMEEDNAIIQKKTARKLKLQKVLAQ